jgi:hypothetical protein
VETPLRFVLRYDPVFLELGRRLEKGEWGRPNGASVSAALSRAEDEREALAFLVLLFGMPQRASRSSRFPLARSILLYDSFALSIDCVVAEEALSSGRAAALAGSLSCSTAFVEFRLGTDRLLAAARDEEHCYRASMAEGDGERYRRMDEIRQGGPVIADPAADTSALAAADRLLSSGTLG